MTEQHPYDLQPGEPLRWFHRFAQYRLTPRPRALVDVYWQEIGNRTGNKAPSRWYTEAKKWRWEERAAAWDAEQDALQEQAVTQERARIVKTRYALMHKRLEQLDRLAQKLIDYADDEQKVWLPDVKAIGNGPGAERVDLVQFNDALFREIRAHFADMAAELGERVKKSETAITSLPKVYLDLDPDEDGSID